MQETKMQENNQVSEKKDKIQTINGVEVCTMDGYLERRGFYLYFVNTCNTEYMINKMIKIDKNKSVDTSRYLLDVDNQKFIKINDNKWLNDKSQTAIKGMGKLRKGTSKTKMFGIF